MVSYNIICRKNYPHFYEHVDIIRLNSPYYSKEELIHILENNSKTKFIDVNIKYRMKQKKANHDFHKLLKLIGSYNVSWVGISNVESIETYGYVKAILGNDKVRICAKIETELGCWHAEDIMFAFDGIMVDTEDLAFEVGWNRAVEEKDRIYQLCEKHKKPHFRLAGVIFEYIKYKTLEESKIII